MKGFPEALRQGDIFDEVAAAITAKELLREFYAAPSLAIARRRLDRFYAHARTARVAEVSRLARTITRWEPEILTFFETQTSNAGSEAMNLITEKLRRISVYRPSTAGGSRGPPLVQRRVGHWDHHRSWR